MKTVYHSNIIGGTAQEQRTQKTPDRKTDLEGQKKWPTIQEIQNLRLINVTWRNKSTDQKDTQKEPTRFL